MYRFINSSGGSFVFIARGVLYMYMVLETLAYGAESRWFDSPFGQPATGITVSELTVHFIGYHRQMYREYKYSLITSSRKSNFFEVFHGKIYLIYNNIFSVNTSQVRNAV